MEYYEDNPTDRQADLAEDDDDFPSWWIALLYLLFFGVSCE